MIPHKLRKEIWKYNHGNKKGYSDGIASKIMGSLYPEGFVTTGNICRALGVRGPVARAKVIRVIRRLWRRGLVSVDPKGTTLTDLGRWFAISHRLGVSFLELCALACTCCTESRYAAEGKRGFYLKSSFERLFDKYYSRKYLGYVFSSLSRKGYVKRLAKKSVRTSPGRREHLMSAYGTYLEGLEEWLYELKEQEVEIISGAVDLVV